jgi:hypothetical protein
LWCLLVMGCGTLLTTTPSLSSCAHTLLPKALKVPHRYLDQKPETRNLKTSTLSSCVPRMFPKASNVPRRYPRAETRNPKPETRTRNPKP